METLSNAAEHLTWDKLWLYVTLMTLILIMIKLSRIADLFTRKLDADLRLAEAQRETEWRKQHLLSEEITTARRNNPR